MSELRKKLIEHGIVSPNLIMSEDAYKVLWDTHEILSKLAKDPICRTVWYALMHGDEFESLAVVNKICERTRPEGDYIAAWTLYGRDPREYGHKEALFELNHWNATH